MRQVPNSNVVVVVLPNQLPKRHVLFPLHRSEDNNKIQSWLESKRPEAYRGKKPYANKILWITNFDGQPTRHPHGDASQYAQYGISHTLDEVNEQLTASAPCLLHTPQSVPPRFPTFRTPCMHTGAVPSSSSSGGSGRPARLSLRLH